MLFDRESWNRFMAGYVVVDATIGFEEGRLGFLLYEELERDAQMEDGFQIRLLAVKLTNPVETRFFSLPMNDIGIGAQLSSAWSPRDTEFIAVGANRQVYAYKPKEYKSREQDIQFPERKLSLDAYTEIGCSIEKTTRIGSSVFAVGAPFRIFERITGHQWVEHGSIPIPAELGSSSRATLLNALSASGFHDIGGLHPDHFYAVGESGAIWRKQGGSWTQLSFPGNADLHTVAVTPEGLVYVTDMRGSVWMGADDNWERVFKAENTLPYKDSVWFKGRLYCSNNSAGCFVFEDGEMVAAHQAKNGAMPPGIAVHAHNLDVTLDGNQLRVAGMYGASMYDGTTWNVLFDGEPD